jgi:hypothetical protein
MEPLNVEHIDYNKLTVILQVLASVEPAPMDFKYFFPAAGEVEREGSSGITAFLLQGNYIRQEGTAHSFVITEAGKTLLHSHKTPQGTPTGEAVVEGNDMMMSLQPDNWPHMNEALWTPLIHHFGKLKGDFPIITFGTDSPTHFEPFPLTERNKELIPELMDMARENIEKIEVTIHDQNTGIVFIEGHCFAAEKILDTKFMLSLHQRLNSEILAASVPSKGFLFVSKKPVSTADLEAFRFITHSKYSETEESKPLSKQIFMIMDGQVRGLINPEGI